LISAIAHAEVEVSLTNPPFRIVPVPPEQPVKVVAVVPV
jgi:hypothetical protein